MSDLKPDLKPDLTPPSCEDEPTPVAREVWEYKFKADIIFHTRSQLLTAAIKDALDTLGAEGWELATITPDGAWFKRRKEAA